MKSHDGERFSIIDDFLPTRVLRELQSYAASMLFSPVDSVVDPRVDGKALRSQGGILNPEKILLNTGLNAAAEAILKAVREHPRIYGKTPDAWTLMSFAFWKYPAGSRLGWHNDAGGGRTGEYILYLHDLWRASWGGELVLIDEPPAHSAISSNALSRVGAIERAVSESSVPRTAIHPMPNRLVLVKAGTYHYINRVDLAAGAHHRISMTGFTSLTTASKSSAARVSKLGDAIGWTDAPHSPSADRSINE